MTDPQPTDRLLPHRRDEVEMSSGRSPRSPFPRSPAPQSSNPSTGVPPPHSHAIPLDELPTEGDEGWNLPPDHSDEEKLRRTRTLGALESLTLVTVFVYAIVVLIYEDLLRTWREMFYYVIAVLLSDSGVALIAGLFLGLAYCMGGYSARNQVKPCTSIFLQVFRAIACYTLFGYGVYFIYKHYDKLLKDHWVLFGFIILETFVTFVYALLTCPAVYGGLSYIGYKIRRKVRRSPLVEFHQADRPNWFSHYFGLDRLGIHLGHGGRPTREDLIQLRRDIDDFKEPEFQMGEEIGSLTETPMDELMHRMGLDEKAPPDDLEESFKEKEKGKQGGKPIRGAGAKS